MRKKMLFFHLAYYILSLLIYMGFLFGSAKLFHTSNLGAAIALTYGLMFLATPIIIVVLMRFSLMKWYVDPLAAAEVPLFLYLGMIVNQMKHTGELRAAVLLVNNSLCDNGGGGWVFLIGLFIFGLLASFSFARKRGESISYKLIGKMIP